VDADRMQEVFTNLLSNASKFSEEDSPISITLSLDGEDYA
jgi:signal transduction histidine kinase